MRKLGSISCSTRTRSFTLLPGRPMIHALQAPSRPRMYRLRSCREHKTLHRKRLTPFVRKLEEGGARGTRTLTALREILCLFNTPGYGKICRNFTTCCQQSSESLHNL